MQDCWQYESEDRPTFVEICNRLLGYANDEFKRNSFITSALCQRVVQRNQLASGDQDEVPIDEAERAPLQANGNGNGQVRNLDNGHAIIPPDAMRDFNGGGDENGSDPSVASAASGAVEGRQNNMWQRFRRMLRNRGYRGHAENGSNGLNITSGTNTTNHASIHQQAVVEA